MLQAKLLIFLSELLKLLLHLPLHRFQFFVSRLEQPNFFRSEVFGRSWSIEGV